MLGVLESIYFKTCFMIKRNYNYCSLIFFFLFIFVVTAMKFHFADLKRDRPAFDLV